MLKRFQKLQANEWEADKTNEGFRYAAAALALGVGKYFTDPEETIFSPSSEPDSDRWYNLIPYELDADVANGGFSMAYFPRLHYLGNQLSLDFKFTPVGYSKFGRDRIWFSQGDLYLSRYTDRFFTSVGLGPTLTYVWQGRWRGHNELNVGMAGYVESFRSVRLTLGIRHIGKEQFSGNNFYVGFGITDLPGLVKRIGGMK